MPILNHRDYRSAKTQIAQLSRAVNSDLIEDLVSHLPADAASARQQTLKAELERLQADVAAYEKLRAYEVNSEPDIHVNDLGLLPIVGRITRRLSQRELAERLQIKEQQIQRYESERYSGISLARYQKTLEALGIELQPRLTPWIEGEPSQTLKVQNQYRITPELLREIRKREWIEFPKGIENSDAAEKVDAFIEHAFKLSPGKPFHRKSSTAGSEAGEVALLAWQARVLHMAANQRERVKGKFSIADASWLKQLVTLSVYPDGPIRAADLLREKGILLVVEPQLPNTLLDGAALMLLESIPVVALTLRYDRLDNFWFVLLHELAHIFLHFNHGLDAGFLDDLDVEGIEKAEIQADGFARSHLLPDEIWNRSPTRFAKYSDMVVNFAQSKNIHPAIVAGRIRNERNDYRTFSELIGQGQVRRLFTTYTF